VSSAILYVAIVVIWACVLIPRWLRRDSARGSSHQADNATPGDVAPPDDGSGEHDSSSADASDRHEGFTVTAATVGPVGATTRDDEEERRDDRAEERRRDTAEDQREQEEGPRSLTPEESRRRTLSARRRLLGMLIALEAAAIALAVLALAAMWVVIPPTLMLAGYLLILREASHADAERAEQEREAEALARAHARGRARNREQAVRHGTAAPAGAAGSTVRAGSTAPAAQYDDPGPGRDFAPGLAGKYTTSNADIIDITARATDDVPYESPDSKLRAVGD
jgi:hypothetical protein